MTENTKSARPLSQLFTAVGQPDEYNPELRMRTNVRKSLSLLGGSLIISFIALALVPIGGAVVAPGQVGVESRVKRIAHASGGVVDRLFVANGDNVSIGQPLVQLANEVAGTDSLYSNLTLTQMLAQRARLDAERTGRSTIEFPPDLLNSKEDAVRSAIASERRLFETRIKEATRLKAQLLARIDQYRKQIVGIEAQIVSLRKQQDLMGPERAGVRALWEKGLVTISRLNQLERLSVEMEGSVAALQAEIAQVKARIGETQEQVLTLDQTRRSDAGAQFAVLSNAINDQQVKRATADDIDRRSMIRAPYSGVVDKLTLTSIGDVVKPSETIMEIVPDNDRLTIEVMLSPIDIDQVRVGQATRIKFTAFNSTTTPEFAGHLTFIAADRTTDREGGVSFYSGRVEIDAKQIRQYPEILLKPGMPAEVFIKTRSRSMISYLTKPIRDQLNRAFRDD